VQVRAPTGQERDKAAASALIVFTMVCARKRRFARLRTQHF
jgi:hypothetical protein